jgi:uroporphyrinogen decarboxylase
LIAAKQVVFFKFLRQFPNVEFRFDVIDVIGCVAGAILTPGYQQAEKVKPAPGTLSAEKVVETTVDTIKIMGKNGGYIVAPTHAIPGDVPAENIDALIRLFQNQP